MIAIYKRELKSYFQTVIGWLFIAAVIALYGLYFFAYNLRAGYPYISYSLQAISFIMLIAVPILTMRSMAEDRHSKTDQLILTAPVSLGKIVIGKYLAMLTIFSIDILMIAVTPLILRIYGSVPLSESYVAVFGFWLFGAACIAIGLLISTLTESQVIAAVLTFAVLFLGYMMNGITGLISESGNLLTAILNCLDLYTPFGNFMNGCLDLTGTVYFLTVIGLCLFLSCQVIQKRRFCFSAKKIGTSVFSIGTIAIAVAVAVVVNLVVNELPSTITSVDATSTKLYSLTDDTKSYLKQLDKDVTIYVLASEDSTDETVHETLKRYEDLSGHVTVQYKNPNLYPDFYLQYTDSAPTSGSLIVASDERSRVISYNDIYEYEMDYTTYSSTITGYDAEGQITSAIQYVTMDASELPVLYEVTGHGELSLDGGFAEAVEKANITSSELTLLTEDEVPEDAAVLVINCPSSDFSDDDADKVIAYLEKGGKALIITDYQYQDLTNFNRILSTYGVSRVDGIVAENNKQYYYNNNPLYILPNVASSSYTSSVSGKYIFAPYAEGLSFASEDESLTGTELLTTTEDAVSKTDSANATTPEYEDGDIRGAFALGIAVEKTVDDETMQMVVLGSCAMFTDSADQVVSGANATMFTEILSQMVGDDTLTTSVIPVKDYSYSNITITSIHTIIGGLAAAVIIPIILLLTGIIIWAARRKR